MARVKSDNLISEELIDEMAPPKSRGQLASSRSFSKLLGGKYHKAGLFTVDGRGRVERNPLGMFLLNPATWTESKSANWAAKEVPGQSNPVYQYISSGARVVDFDALVTKDFGDSDEVFSPKNQSFDPLKVAKKFVADIAASFSGAIVNVPINAPRADVTKADTQGIQDYLNYYRSLEYPLYSTSRRLERSPPLLVLYAGSTLTKFGREPELPGSKSRISFNHEVWILTNLRISVTKQLPDLTPMEATVSFQMTQYNTRSISRDKIAP